MAIGIYKPGQGYWVRVMTAAVLGIAIMATAAWLWTQMGVVASKLPTTSWVLVVGNPQGVPADGQTVELLSKPVSSGTGSVSEPAKIGTATVESYNPTTGQLRVGHVVLESGDPTETAEVRSAAAGAEPAFSARSSGSPTGVPMIEPILLQGLVAALVLLVGAILVYYYVAVHQGAVEFLIATDMEMKKVNWSTRREILSNTWVVIGASILIAGSLFVVDLGFQAFFKAIGILQG